VETTITATELARNLSDVLNRIRYRGERFLVERNGEPVARLDPVESSKVLTFRQLIELIRRIEQPDDQFADDLEAIQASQPKAEFPEWPS
jgi:prevent-host-death family protein